MSAVCEKIQQYYRDNLDAYQEKCDLFIHALQEKPIIRRACIAAGLDRTTPYVWRANDPEFKRRWDEALEGGSDEVEDSLYDMATSRRNVAATIIWLKAHRPKYREEQRIIIAKEVDEAIDRAISEHQLPAALGPALEPVDAIDTATLSSTLGQPVE